MEISRWITHAALWDSDKVAIHFEGDSLTYGGFAQRIAKLAGALRELGVGAGDRVAHLGYNGPEILELLFASARLGAALTPLNWRLAVPEYSFIVGDAKPSLLFVEQPFYDQAQTLAVVRRYAAAQHAYDNVAHYKLESRDFVAAGDLDVGPHAERKAGNVPIYWVGAPPPPKLAATLG